MRSIGPRKDAPGGRSGCRVWWAPARFVKPLMKAPVGAVLLKPHSGPDLLAHRVAALSEFGFGDDRAGERSVRARMDCYLSPVEGPDPFDARRRGGGARSCGSHGCDAHEQQNGRGERKRNRMIPRLEGPIPVHSEHCYINAPRGVSSTLAVEPIGTAPT